MKLTKDESRPKVLHDLYIQSLLSLFYVGVLFTLTQRLHRFFPRFFGKERNKIFLVKGVIIAAIISRIGMNALSSIYQQEMNDSYASGDWFYPTYLLCSSILASLMPLTAIILSLLYAMGQKRRIMRLAEAREEQREGGSMESFLVFEDRSDDEIEDAI